jgi:ABC-type microcin C transport system permease subunit YejE
MAKDKKTEEKSETLNAIVRRQFNKNRPAVWSLRLLILIFLIGISADFIANERPYYCQINGKSYRHSRDMVSISAWLTGPTNSLT